MCTDFISLEALYHHCLFHHIQTSRKAMHNIWAFSSQWDSSSNSPLFQHHQIPMNNTHRRPSAELITVVCNVLRVHHGPEDSLETDWAGLRVARFALLIHSSKMPNWSEEVIQASVATANFQRKIMHGNATKTVRENAADSG